MLNGPIVWFTDQKALTTFLTNDPPQNERMRRWWVFLAQLKINVCHIQGIKNEYVDFISRNVFDRKFQVDSEKLAEQAFAKMDAHLDLFIEGISVVSWKIDEVKWL